MRHGELISPADAVDLSLDPLGCTIVKVSSPVCAPVVGTSRAVTCTVGFCTIPDTRRAAAEALRVLRPGGASW